MKGIPLVMMSALCLWTSLSSAQDAKFDTELATSLKLVVMVRAQLGAAPAFGAGIVFGREKDRLYILTANHVVRRGDAEATGIQVNLRTLPARALPARLLPRFDREMDIAVLMVENLASQGIDVCALSLDRLGDPTALRRGSGVYPVGNPNGAAWGMPVSHDQVSMVTGDEIAFQSPFLAVGASGARSSTRTRAWSPWSAGTSRPSAWHCRWIRRCRRLRSGDIRSNSGASGRTVPPRYTRQPGMQM